MKYTFLFVNLGGDFEAIAMRVKAEGHSIYFYKTKGQHKGSEDTGIGIFTKEEMINDIYEVLLKFKDKKKELIILVDDNKNRGFEFDYLSSEGWQVIGGASYTETIEYERSKGLDLMRSIGVDIPFEKTFTDLDAGIEFAKGEDNDARYVFKPEGEEFGGSSKTYTATNKQDLINYLTWIKSDCQTKHYEIKKFVLQEFVNGIEADFAGYFDGEKFVDELCIIDIEEKKSGDGNKGEAVGCAGNIIINFPKSKYLDILKKLTPLLKKINYVGEISINNIFAEETGNEKKQKKYVPGKPYGLEFTSRFGWDAHLTECSIIRKAGGRISDFYIALATKTPYKFPPNLIGCGVRVYTGSISLKQDEVAGRYFSFDKSVFKNLWFYSVSRKDSSFIIEDNPVLVAHFVSENLPSAIQGCYNVLKKTNIPDAYYRNQIGERAAKVLRYLKKWNWI